MSELEKPLSDSFAAALLYACQLHRSQGRKGTQVPYISHLMGVCALVLEDGGSETEAIAALLHDAIEDQSRDGRTESEIRERFGEAVLQIVLDCTDATVEPKPDWRPRKDHHLKALRTASPPVARVAAADKLYNARSILSDTAKAGEKVWERFKVPKEESLWYYGELVKTLGKVHSGFLVEELGRTVERLRNGALESGFRLQASETEPET